MNRRVERNHYKLRQKEKLYYQNTDRLQQAKALTNRLDHLTRSPRVKPNSRNNIGSHVPLLRLTHHFSSSTSILSKIGSESNLRLKPDQSPVPKLDLGAVVLKSYYQVKSPKTVRLVNEPRVRNQRIPLNLFRTVVATEPASLGESPRAGRGKSSMLSHFRLNKFTYKNTWKPHVSCVMCEHR